MLNYISVNGKFTGIDKRMKGFANRLCFLKLFLAKLKILIGTTAITGSITRIECNIEGIVFFTIKNFRNSGRLW